MVLNVLKKKFRMLIKFFCIFLIKFGKMLIFFKLFIFVLLKVNIDELIKIIDFWKF